MAGFVVQGHIYARTSCNTPKTKKNLKSHHMTPLIILRMEKDRSSNRLQHRGHITTSGVHYFSNNFKGLESQPHLRHFISRHLSCFRPENSNLSNNGMIILELITEA